MFCSQSVEGDYDDRYGIHIFDVDQDASATSLGMVRLWASPYAQSAVFVDWVVHFTLSTGKKLGVLARAAENAKHLSLYALVRAMPVVEVWVLPSISIHARLSPRENCYLIDTEFSANWDRCVPGILEDA